jgi:hypothetical protein
VECSGNREPVEEHHSNYRGISPLWHTQRMQAWNAEMQRIAIADALASHGGLTPAAPYCVLATFRTMFVRHGVRQRCAPVVSGVCKSETVTRRLRRPVGRFNETPLRLPNHGGLTPAAPGCAFANVRFSRHGVRFTDPRRADARRSCERAFVHRKWRFMRRTNVVHQERLA